MYRFLKQFIKYPGKTGSVAESSSALCNSLTQPLENGENSVILELGTGSGAVTEAIFDRKNRRARYIGFEINEEFAEITKERVPQAEVINKNAVYAPEIIEKMGIDKCDCVVSGLPWSIFPESLQNELLDSLTQVLKPGGTFVTYAYVHGSILPSARRFYRKIYTRFEKVDKSRVVWSNLPPAVVYVAEKCALNIEDAPDEAEIIPEELGRKAV